MAAEPPDHARQSLLASLVAAKAEANRLGAKLAASLIGMAILSVSPSWTGKTIDPTAQNDNRSQPESE